MTDKNWVIQYIKQSIKELLIFILNSEWRMDNLDTMVKLSANV